MNRAWINNLFEEGTKEDQVYWLNRLETYYKAYLWVVNNVLNEDQLDLKVPGIEKTSRELFDNNH